MNFVNANANVNANVNINVSKNEDKNRKVSKFAENTHNNNLSNYNSVPLNTNTYNQPLYYKDY